MVIPPMNKRWNSGSTKWTKTAKYEPRNFESKGKEIIQISSPYLQKMESKQYGVAPGLVPMYLFTTTEL